MQTINYNCVVGIDPGSNGGIATWRDGKITTLKMPKNLADLREYYSYLKSVSNPIVFLEKVQMRQDDVSVPGKAFRIQQLLMSAQKLRDHLEVEKVPYILVHPISWQSYMKLLKKNEEKKDRKNRYKEAAKHYYPTSKPTLNTADAILILHFGRLKLIKEPDWVKSNLILPSSGGLKFENAK